MKNYYQGNSHELFLRGFCLKRTYVDDVVRHAITQFGRLEAPVGISGAGTPTAVVCPSRPLCRITIVLQTLLFIISWIISWSDIKLCTVWKLKRRTYPNFRDESGGSRGQADITFRTDVGRCSLMMTLSLPSFQPEKEKNPNHPACRYFFHKEFLTEMLTRETFGFDTNIS